MAIRARVTPAASLSFPLGQKRERLTLETLSWLLGKASGAQEKGTSGQQLKSGSQLHKTLERKHPGAQPQGWQ
jgi:hypothetical protein